MEELKFDYKNDMYTGLRKYNKIDNADGTVSFEDVTTYQQVGNIYSADDINSTNKAVNEFYTEYTAKVDDITGLTIIPLPVANWSATAPYTQTIEVVGMKDTDTPVPGIIYPNSMTEVQEAQIDKSAAMIKYLTTNNGSVTFQCPFKKPTIDLTISLKGV